MASRNSRKSSGLRLLWIPGGRKSHPKGRYNSTSKQVSYTTRQKKSEVWSLGGSKAQQNLLQADPHETLVDGPSTSGLSSLACATAASGATAAASSTQCLESHNSPEPTTEKSNQKQISPTTPNSSTSTAPLISPPLSPLEQNVQLSNNNNSTLPSITSSTTTAANTMPAKSHQPIPIIVTATTTADIMDENRFSLLVAKDIVTNDFEISGLPSPPTYNLNSQENLNNSSGTTLSQVSPSESPHKTNNESQNGSVNNSPVKKKNKNRNHNNNQGDVNSIESITEDNVSEKIPSGDLGWIGEFVQERQDHAILAKPQKKKKKKHAKELDQLDGVPMKENSSDSSVKEEDEKVVKCLYYTLMCCDCTIS